MFVLRRVEQFRQRRKIQERIDELVDLLFVSARDVIVNRAIESIPGHFTSRMALAVRHVEARHYWIIVHRPKPCRAAFRLRTVFIAGCLPARVLCGGGFVT